VEGLEGMLMAGEEMLQGLGDGELQIHQAAVTEHHDEEAELTPGRTDLDRAILAPIDLSRLPGGKGEGQKGWSAGRAHLMHIGFHGRIAALKAVLLQALEDLPRAIGMGFQEAHDLRFERIQFAGARPGGFAAILGGAQPVGDGAAMEPERPGDLADPQVRLGMIMLDLTKGLIVNQGVFPSA
jgi:hypothetical protein